MKIARPRIRVKALAQDPRNCSEALKFVREVNAALDKGTALSVTEANLVLANKNMVLDFTDIPTDSGSGSSGSKSGGIRMVRTKIPRIEIPPAALKKLNDISTRLSGHAQLIQDLRNRGIEWRRAFARSPEVKPLLTEIGATIKRLERAIQAGHSEMEDVGGKYVPKQFVSLCESLEESIETQMGEEFDSLSSETLTWVRVDDGVPNFYVTHTIELKDFQTRDGSSVPSYYIVVSLHQGADGVSTHVTTLQEPETFGTYDLGPSFTGTDGALQTIDTLLDLDRFDAHLYDVPIPAVDTEKMDLGEHRKLVDNFSLNKVSQTLELRTTKYLPKDKLTVLLEAVMAQFPQSLRLGKVRFSTTIECVLTGTTKANRPITEDVVGDAQYNELNGGKFEVRVISDSLSGIKLDTNRLVTRLKTYSVTPVEAGVPHNLVSFRMTGNKRTDIRHLREFVNNLDTYLTPKQIYSVRKALGV